MNRLTRKMTKKMLAFLLALTMIFTNSSMTILAEGVMEESQQTEENGQPANAEMDLSEGQTGVALEENAEAGKEITSEEDTEGEKETASEEENTEAGKETALEENTEAEKEAASEEKNTEAENTSAQKEAETNTEDQTTNVFYLDNGEVSASVVLDIAIPADASFVAEQKESVSSYYIDAVKKAQEWAAEFGMEVQDTCVYDLHFEKDGEVLPVNTSSEVTLQFHEPKLNGGGICTSSPHYGKRC